MLGFLLHQMWRMIEPSRGEVEQLNRKGISAAHTESELQDIFVVLTEQAVKGGSAGHNDKA